MEDPRFVLSLVLPDRHVSEALVVPSRLAVG